MDTISIKSSNTQNLKSIKSPKKYLSSSYHADNSTSPNLIKNNLNIQSYNENIKSSPNKIKSKPTTTTTTIHSSSSISFENLYTAEVPSIKNKNNKSLITSSPKKIFNDKSTNSSPKHLIDAKTSPIIDNVSITREYALKIEIDKLQEKLKDTEERLQSLRIQHDSLSQLHRDLRDNHTRLQEESELLKLDVQHLTECANVLRNELQLARNDRNEALDIQKILQNELEENKIEKKKAQEQCEKDAKIIQDLQRQCKEMERILMRKHPDSVSALIGNFSIFFFFSRKLFKKFLNLHLISFYSCI